jgi:hypothetical protein
LFSTNIPVSNWLTRLSNWQNEQSKIIGVQAAMSLKSNVTSAIAEKRISWDNLMRGYAILGYVKLEITIIGYKAVKGHKGDKIELTVLSAPERPPTKEEIITLKREAIEAIPSTANDVGENNE